MVAERPNRRTQALGVTVAMAVLVLLPGRVAQAVTDAARDVPTVAKPARAQLKSLPTHHWHDGGTRRALTLESGLEVDFTPRAGKRIDAPQRAGTAATGSGALVSPVLRDESGRLRALPGGVVVVLVAPVDEAAVLALLARAGVDSARRISAATWLVPSDAGLPALALANRLHDTGLFASAQPNWWVQRTLK